MDESTVRVKLFFENTENPIKGTMRESNLQCLVKAFDKWRRSVYIYDIKFLDAKHFYINLRYIRAIYGDSTLDLPYDANVAIQSNAIDGSDIGQIVFTVAWHK